MKIKSIIGSILLTVGALAFVSAPANAGECSAEDPCHTYAMVDGNGTVTNIIVCQPSVCGSGTFAGSRVVPQVAANPVTHQNQGGYLSNPDSTPVKESNGRFTVTNDSPVVSNTVIQEETKNVVLTSSIEKGTQTSFTFNDTVGASDGRPTFRSEPMDKTIGATLSVTELSKSETPTVIAEEVAVFEERQTEQFVELTIQLNNLQKIMRNWNWFKMSLVGWFI
jgi:hypothetical protein